MNNTATTKPMSEKPLLSVSGLASGYGHIAVLEDVAIEVTDRSIVTVLGGNGAGKSTLLKTISGLLPATRGSIRFDGQGIAGGKPIDIVGRGLLHVAEGRRLFRSQVEVSHASAVTSWRGPVSAILPNMSR